MNALLLMLICGAGYVIAYHTYGKFLARKIFALDPAAKVPSRQFEDGIDYVPTRKGIVFGHHYTSIAGTGPIVGPAIGIIWGWIPAVLWVLFGCILMGAVHDFGALIVSMRNQGKSLSEVAARYINIRVRFIFFAVVFLTVMIVIAIFGVVISAVFTRFPSAVVPVWLQIPIAIGLGYAIYRRGANVTVATLVAVAAMYASVALGSWFPIEVGDTFGIPASGFWVIILLIYAWIASTLPVQTLLQPRDFINAWQLNVAMGLLAVGVIVAAATTGLSMSAPAINPSVPANTPPIWPAMFVIIACGAISGFHSLVASGTTPKQVSSETDSLFIGYGSMLLEGFLAVLVIICIGAGVGMLLRLEDGTALYGTAAWNHYYSTWIGDSGLSDKIAPVVEGAANLMGAVGVGVTLGITIMGVFIASFAGTTLDTAVRLQRYVIGELATDLGFKSLSNRWAATTIAVLTAAGLAFMTGVDGTGAMRLWPLFGSANQLLAALALLVVTIYLRRLGGLKYLVTAIPCLLMLLITNWAMVTNEITFFNTQNWLLLIIGGCILLLSIWMTIETAVVFFTAPLPAKTARQTAAA
ncbi:MAG: carbon starvation protein A [Acidobacteriota bacterium]|nr:MAG: carbon starvation protein A [Acidobacteriota bacterium]